MLSVYTKTGFMGHYSLDVFGWFSINFDQFDLGMPAVATAYSLPLSPPTPPSWFL